MKLNLYTIRDIKSAFGSPFTAQNDEVAKRIFGTAVLSSDNDIYRYPEDFSLYCNGVFDGCDGTIDSCVPRFLAQAVDFKKGSYTDEA